MTDDDYKLINTWINAVGNVPDKLGFQFIYAEGWKTATSGSAWMTTNERRALLSKLRGMRNDGPGIA